MLLKFKFLVVLVFLFPLVSRGITLKIFDICKPETIFENNVEADLNNSLGKITTDLFDQNEINYVGDEKGITAINNSATGMDAIEQLSSGEIRIYGWCYRVNGEVVYDLASTQYMKNQDDSVEWFYGYAYYNQTWLGMCLPVHELTNSKFCKNLSSLRTSKYSVTEI